MSLTILDKLLLKIDKNADRDYFYEVWSISFDFSNLQSNKVDHIFLQHSWED